MNTATVVRAVIFLAAVAFMVAAALVSLADHSPWKALAYGGMAILPLTYAVVLWRKRNL